MNRTLVVACAFAFVVVLPTSSLQGGPGPYDGKQFRGRIAYSADGNFNDEDDWAASPVALAIFARFGVKDRLVHFDYNCILSKTDSKWEKEHEKSVLGAARQFGYPRSIFHDCQKDKQAAIDSIRQAINASSADNPLWFILAGPMEVPYLGIQASDPGRRKFVYCISHSRWNDGYAREDFVHHNKRDVIPSGVKWVQIADQNQFLTTSPYGRPARAEEWKPYHWMRDSKDEQVRFLWERMRATRRADCSDAGMAYFLMTGDEKTEIAKLQRLLEKKGIPKPIAARTVVRLEAENFLTLHNFEVEHQGKRASQRLSVKLSKGEAGHIETVFDEPYTAAQGKYNVEVRYFDSKGARPRFRLSINGVPHGEAWSPAGKNGWQTRRIGNVHIRSGDRIAVRVEGKGGRLDYIQLNAVPE
jgi:hypothetical protein